MKRRMLTLLVCVLACLGVSAPAAYALSPDSSGSVVDSSESIASETVESDIYWLGESTSITSSEIGGDFIGAGYTIGIESSSVGGNVRAAASELTVNGTTVAGNMTVAGSTVQVGQGTTANGVYAVAEDFGFYGTASRIYVDATTVTIDGTVSGDVEIYADEVVVGSNTKITGTLTVYSEDAPTIDDGASVGTYSYEYYDGSDDSLSALGQSAGLVSLLVIVVMTLLIAWLAKKPVDESASMLKSTPANMIFVGALTVALAPLVAIILVSLLVTAPFGIAIFCVILALSCIALPFTAAATGKAIFKDMNNVLSGLLIGIIAGVLSMVSILAYILAIYSAIFTAGYLVCKIMEKVKASKSQVQPIGGSNGSGNPYDPGYGNSQQGGPQDPYGGQGYGGSGYGNGQGYGNDPYGGQGDNGSGYGNGQGYGDGSYGDGLGSGGGQYGDWGGDGSSQDDGGQQSGTPQDPYGDGGSGYQDDGRRG